MENKYGVIIGRFQTSYLTNGHKFIIDTVLKKHSKLIILIGIHMSQPTKRNPLDYITRKLMIEELYPNVTILPLYDHSNDSVWSMNIDLLITGTSFRENAIIYGSRDSCLKHYSGAYKTEYIESDLPDNATEIRKDTASKSLSNQQFREGIIYALSNRNQSPYLVVDVAMIKETISSGELIEDIIVPVIKTIEVLLGRKEGEIGYRFIGGFVDSSDACIKDAVHRELLEEVGQIEVGDFELIGEAMIDDWRYRNDEEKIFSCFFKCKYVFGRVHPCDDMPCLEWIPLEKLAETKFIPEHVPLQNILIENLKQNKK